MEICLRFKWKCHKRKKLLMILMYKEIQTTNQMMILISISVVDYPLNMPFPEVQSLENILPLSSTPNSSLALPPARLSSVRPRGLLPLEIEESPLHQQSSSRIQSAISKRADQVRKLLSKSNSDSGSWNQSRDERRGGKERADAPELLMLVLYVIMIYMMIFMITLFMLQKLKAWH